MSELVQVVAIVGLVVALVVPTVRVLAEGCRGPEQQQSETSEVQDQLIREHLLDRYVITLLSGESFSGLLAEVDDRTLILRDVEVLSKDNAKVAGDVVLRRESVAYMQRPN